MSSVPYWGANRQYNAKRKRVCLPEVMPVSTPYLVNIDPTNHCNLKCRFCPTGHPELLEKFSRPRGMMDFGLFTKIIDELAMFPEKVKVLLLHKDGEPMLNPRLADMLKYAKQKDIAEVIWLTTNMTLLTPKLAEDIVDSGVDFIRVSVNHVTDQGYKDLTVVWSDYEKVRANTALLFDVRNRKGSSMKIWAKLNNFGLSEEEILKFGRDFKGISDDHMLANPMGWTYSQEFDFRLGVKTELGQEGEVPLKENRVVCPYPFYRMVLNFNGDVSVCELDWSMSTVVGNVHEETMWEIWNGKRVHAFRMAMLEGMRWNKDVCKQCSCIMYMPSENDMDDHRERLLELYHELGPSAPAKAWAMRQNGTWTEPA